MFLTFYNTNRPKIKNVTKKFENVTRKKREKNAYMMI